jgi:hypothetical protein
MTDDQRDILREALDQMERMRGLVWGPEWMEEVAAALRALLAENAALKAQADPLAEMWAALEEYQPQADRDGHGDTWRAMCAERTVNAALDVSGFTRGWSANAPMWVGLSLSYRGTNAEKSAQHASEAIDSIRRAKEAQPDPLPAKTYGVDPANGRDYTVIADIGADGRVESVRIDVPEDDAKEAKP